jgi:hypothetical protein
MDQHLHHDHDCTIRNRNNPLITKVLSIDWPQTPYIPTNDQLGRKANYDGQNILIVDCHATQLIPRVRAYADSQVIKLTQVAAHSSYISQPLDSCVSGVITIHDKCEAERK